MMSGKSETSLSAWYFFRLAASGLTRGNSAPLPLPLPTVVSLANRLSSSTGGFHLGKCFLPATWSGRSAPALRPGRGHGGARCVSTGAALAAMASGLGRRQGGAALSRANGEPDGMNSQPIGSQ